MEPGGTATVSFCLDYLQEALESGLLFVEETMSFDDTRAFYDPTIAGE